MRSCSLADSRYVKALKDFQKAKINEEKNRKRKFIMNEISEVTEKEKTVKSCIKSLERDIESYSIAALLAKANSFCHTLRKKKDLISELDYALEKLNDELKNI